MARTRTRTRRGYGSRYGRTSSVRRRTTSRRTGYSRRRTSSGGTKTLRIVIEQPQQMSPVVGGVRLPVKTKKAVF